LLPRNNEKESYSYPCQRYSYFDVAVGLVWSNEPESYAGGSIASGRASHARQVKGDDPDNKGYPDSPGWGLGVVLTTQPHKKYVLLRSF
jgi:hypothetical protein